MTKLIDTTFNTIALSVLVTNLFATTASTFFMLYFMDCAKGIEQQYFIEIGGVVDFQILIEEENCICVRLPDKKKIVSFIIKEAAIKLS